MADDMQILSNKSKTSLYTNIIIYLNANLFSLIFVWLLFFINFLQILQ